LQSSLSRVEGRIIQEAPAQTRGILNPDDFINMKFHDALSADELSRTLSVPRNPRASFELKRIAALEINE